MECLPYQSSNWIRVIKKSNEGDKKIALLPPGAHTTARRGSAAAHSCQQPPAQPPPPALPKLAQKGEAPC